MSRNASQVMRNKFNEEREGGEVISESFAYESGRCNI